MMKNGWRVAMALGAALIGFAAMPAQAQYRDGDRDMERHMRHRMMRHEMHREMRHERHREMRRHMRHREMRRMMHHHDY